MVGSNFDRVRIVVVGDAGNTSVHMIEVYKIMHDMYDRSVALELPRNVSLVLEVININCKTTAFITTFENFLLQFCCTSS